MQNILPFFIYSNSRKFESLILLNIHTNCVQKIYKYFLCVFIPYDVALYGEKETCVGWEKKRNHWWNGPYVYVNKWFFIQFTKQILKKWSAQAEL